MDERQELGEPWRTLGVGDQIRIVRLPYQDLPHFQLHESTRKLYQHLIIKRKVLKIAELDQAGRPWVHCRFKSNGKWEHHSLAVDDDS